MLNSEFSHLKAMSAFPPMRAAFQNSVSPSLIKNGTKADSGAIWSPDLTLHSSGSYSHFRELDDKIFTFVAQKTEEMTLGYSHTF